MRISALLLLMLGWSSAFAEQPCDSTGAPLSAPTERFSDNGDGTVVDKASGLMWMRCAVGQEWTGETCSGDADTFAWTATAEAADAINASGQHFFSDWRVPGLRDLAMIVERGCRDPRINSTVFPNTAATFFWTSTERQDDPEGRAYALSFGAEGVEPHAKGLAHQLRLVRTAQ